MAETRGKETTPAHRTIAAAGARFAPSPPEEIADAVEKRSEAP